MSTVEVSDVTSEMYAAVEARAASRSVTVEQYVLDLIRQDLDGAGMEPILGLDTVGTLEALREERTDELVRRISKPEPDGSTSPSGQ